MVNRTLRCRIKNGVMPTALLLLTFLLAERFALCGMARAQRSVGRGGGGKGELFGEGGGEGCLRVVSVAGALEARVRGAAAGHGVGV